MLEDVCIVAEWLNASCCGERGCRFEFPVARFEKFTSELFFLVDFIKIYITIRIRNGTAPPMAKTSRECTYN